MGKLNDHHTKRPYIALKNQMGNVGEMCQTGKGAEISTDSILTMAIGIS